MPTTRRRRPTPFVDGQTDPLHHEVELALLFGRGAHGVPVELQHVDGWRRAWADHRSMIEPKAAEYLPGVRPFVRYVLDELPAPPLLREPPSDHRWYRQWIAGTGRFWTRYPEPWQRDETEWLVEIGEVRVDELARYHERAARPTPRLRSVVFRLLGDYPLELGCYA